jgi:hypothetical protein
MRPSSVNVGIIGRPKPNHPDFKVHLLREGSGKGVVTDREAPAAREGDQ